MSITKPFTFVAGTKARANEVNQDFDILYSQVNTNISNIASNAAYIDTLDNTKANINGSTSQIFKVNNSNDLTAIATADAINKGTLLTAISPLLDYVSGLIITKDSGSPEDTIIISEGSCWDSIHKVVLKLDASISVQNDTQSASTTYYIYIKSSNNNGSNPSIVFSQSSVEPSPGATYPYRLIGYYTTNSDNEIDSIICYGNNIESPSANSVLIETYVNGTSWYKVYSDGWCEQGGIVDNGIPNGAYYKDLTFLKQFVDTDYFTSATPISTTTASTTACIVDKTTTGMRVYVNRTYGSDAYSQYCSWMVAGYIN